MPHSPTIKTHIFQLYIISFNIITIIYQLSFISGKRKSTPPSPYHHSCLHLNRTSTTCYVVQLQPSNSLQRTC